MLTARLKQLLFRAEYRRLAEAEARCAKLTAKAERLLNVAGNEKQLERCKGKVRYDTQKEAQQASLALYYKDLHLLTEYHCPACLGWHLTHTTRPSPFVREQLAVQTSASHIRDRVDAETMRDLMKIGN